MLGAYAGLVVQVFPELHGVNVVFPDGVSYPQGQTETFVRVLSRRAHPQGGAEVCLPQIGELGLVLQVDDDLAVWLGGIHPREESQVPTEEFLSYSRHESGYRHHVHANGDLQVETPHGVVLRITKGADALPRPQGTAKPIEVQFDPPWMEISHPKAGKVTANPDGDIVVDHPGAGKLSLLADGTLKLEHSSGGLLQADSGGTLEASGWSEVAFQTAEARFCMEDFWTWAKTHTHAGVMPGGATTAIPVTPPPDSGLSPTTFKGPKGP